MERPSLKPNVKSDTPTNPDPDKNNKIGALWSRTSHKGYSFFSGQIVITDEFKMKLENAPVDKFGNKLIDVLVFNNKWKEQESHPDYRIILGEPRK